LLAVLFVIVGAAHRARAEEVTAKKMSFAERGGQLVVSTTFTELFDQDSYLALSSGFPTTVVIRLYVYRKGRKLPVSLRVATVRVVYDLWDEVYEIERRDQSGVHDKRLDSRVDSLRELTQLRRFPLADLDDIAIGPHYFLGAVIELNPVEEETLAEMRRWLTRPASETRLDTSSSFFGSFVSVFVNPKLEDAERSVRLRSQPFYRVPR
jgi:hypothetical protein